MTQEVKNLIITAKVLRFCADLFAILGVVMFGFLYYNNYEGNGLAALHDPFFVVTVLVPFIPAAILAWQVSKKRKQIRALLEQQQKSS